MCRWDNADPADVWVAKSRSAVMDHRCLECQRTIHKGELYEWAKQLYNGVWSETKTCRHCHAAATWLHIQCGGYAVGEVCDELIEHWEEGYRGEWLSRAIVRMRHGWARRDGSLVEIPGPPPLCTSTHMRHQHVTEHPGQPCEFCARFSP